MIRNVLASLAVKDLKNATRWYTDLLGWPPESAPMPEVAEWKFSGGGWLQIYRDPDGRAGNGSCTFAVDDIDGIVAKVSQAGIDTSTRADSHRARVLMITDPDGNHLAFAQVLDPSMAH